MFNELIGVAKKYLNQLPKSLFITLALCSVYISFSGLVLAANDPPRFGDISDLLYRLLDLMYAFGGMIFLGLLIFIGFQWMSSAGNEETIGAARKRLLYWVIGFILYFFSATIVTSIYTTLDVRDCTGELRTPGLSIFYESSCPEPTYYIQYTDLASQPNTNRSVCSYGNRDVRELERQKLARTVGSYRLFPALSTPQTDSLERCCGYDSDALNCQ